MEKPEGQSDCRVRETECEPRVFGSKVVGMNSHATLPNDRARMKTEYALQIDIIYIIYLFCLSWLFFCRCMHDKKKDVLYASFLHAFKINHTF